MTRVLSETVGNQQAAATGSVDSTVSLSEYGTNALIHELRLRVGRFVIAERELAGRSVAFETEPTTRVTIRLAKDEF